MTTTIKVSDETKQLLDMLQARMTLALRRKKPLSELIDDITRLALRHEDEIFQSMSTEEKGQNARKPKGKKSSNDADRTDGDIYIED